MKHWYPSIGRSALLLMPRRLVLGCGAAMVAGLASARAQPVVMDQKADTPFMLLSALLIAHRLDPVIGGRIAAEMQAHQPPMSDQIDGLIRLARSRNATEVEAFFPFADAAAQAVALRIISAWYLGVVDNVPGATVIAYEQALMFQPTSDVMTIPTYAISGPNGWGAQAPPADEMPSF